VLNAVRNDHARAGRMTCDVKGSASKYGSLEPSAAPRSKHYKSGVLLTAEFNDFLGG